jgi:hypothetical protein
MMLQARRGAASDQSGAIAVMVALLAVLLLSMGALTVDLGNAYVHKRDMQKRADFSALAGGLGDDLPMTPAGGGCGYGQAAVATDQAIIDVADYLSTHYDTTVTPADLVDCNFTNGEADYGSFSWSGTAWTFAQNKDQIGVVTQANRVDFGMARVLGFQNVDVNGVATVQIKSPLMKTLPFYAKDTCSWGNQSIAQPPPGGAGGLFLFADGQTNTARLTNLVTNPSVSPPTVPLNATAPSNQLVINAESGTLAGVTKVGFFQSGTLSTGPDPEGTPDTTLSTGLNFSNGNSTLTITLPNSVLSVEGQWYVRVKIGANWSPVTTGNGSNEVLRALLLIVGQPTLTCGQGPDQGNFGTLNLPPASPPAMSLSGLNDQIAYNISQGLTSRLAPFPEDLWTTGNLCTNSPEGTLKWPADGTNCVSTKPGVPTSAAEQGFIFGIPHTSYTQGLLQDLDPDHFCPNDSPGGTSHTAQVRGININNDVLSCFLTDDTTTISQITSENYDGPAVLDQSIWNSPRFVSVPVLNFPGNGNSQDYQILGFRPGFLTDQPATATRATGVPIMNAGCSGSANNFSGECNGFSWLNGQLRSLNVVFINQNALPDPPLDPAGKYIPYTGTGPKVPLLVN